MSTGNTPDPDDYYEYYYNHLKSAGKSIKTIDYHRTTGKLFREFLSEQDVSDESEVTPRIAIQFKEFLDTPDRKDITIKSHMSRIGKMYEYYSVRATFDANAIYIGMDEIEWNIDTDTSRVEIPMADMKKAVQETKHYERRTLVTVFLKTGLRQGEVVNLDLRDINLDHEFSDRLLPVPRHEIREDPDTLYIDATINEGDVVNGRKRVSTNKRKRSTKIPIDNELKSVLIQWLMARPPTICPADPLFVRINGPHSGDRHSDDSIKFTLRRWAKKQGWYEKGAGERNNVTAQFFRHFFTTHMRRRVDSEEIGGNEAKYFVKGIRGDTGDDVIDTYTQNWGNYVRNAYKSNIYKLYD